MRPLSYFSHSPIISRSPNYGCALTRLWYFVESCLPIKIRTKSTLKLCRLNRSQGSLRRLWRLQREVEQGPKLMPFNIIRLHLSWFHQTHGAANCEGFVPTLVCLAVRWFHWLRIGTDFLRNCTNRLTGCEIACHGSCTWYGLVHAGAESTMSFCCGIRRDWLDSEVEGVCDVWQPSQHVGFPSNNQNEERIVQLQPVFQGGLIHSIQYNISGTASRLGEPFDRAFQVLTWPPTSFQSKFV
jgi:hypothetical protein